MEESPTAIERLKRRLYSIEGVRMKSRSELSQPAHGVAQRWSAERHAAAHGQPSRPDNSSLIIFLWGSVLFFVGSLALAGFIFLRGGNVVSSERITLEIVGPSLIDGGKKVTLQAIVKNDNQVPLELADLIVTYPEGTRSADDVTKSLPEVRQSLGTIGPRQQLKTTVSAVLFGEEGAQRHISAVLEYRVQGSNAIFVKEGGIDLTVGSSPVTLLVEGPEEAAAGREATFTLSISSNSQETIRGVVAEAQYPFGFVVSETEPETAVGEGLWQLGDLEPREKQTIRIRGILEAQDNEERVFRFSVGSQKSPTDLTLAVPFVTIPHTLTVKKAFIGGTLSLNGSENRTVSVSPGEQITGLLTWRNNLDTEVYDVEIQALLQGEAFDRGSVSASQGFYRSADSSIVWNRDTDESLGAVPPQGMGSVSFSLTPRSATASGALLKNPEFSVAFQVRARRPGGDASDEPTPITATRVLVTSPLAFKARTASATGPFANTGPLPPQVNQATTYTVIWTIDNPSNTIANARVTASLPPSVAFLNATSPASESLSYNASSNSLTWNLGEVKTTTLGSPRMVAFKVALTPSLSQLGSAPVLVGEASFSGDDRFAQTKVTRRTPAVTTRIIGESGFSSGMEMVVE